MIVLGDSTIRVWPGYVETVFPDGTKAPAAPEDNDAYRVTTARLGYTDPWQQCLEHEIFHTWVAQKMGYEHSTILWNVAHGGGKKWPEGGMQEEGYVTGWQKFMRTYELDDMARGFLNRAGLDVDEAYEQSLELLERVKLAMYPGNDPTMGGE